MGKFRGIQIRDGAVVSSHLATGITVNGIIISGSAATQKTFTVNAIMQLDGANVSYNLDSFLTKAGGTVTGSVVVTGTLTASGSALVPSGTTFLLGSGVSGSDLLQALAGISSGVTAATLISLTSGAVISTGTHTHNFDAIVGKVEHMLTKTATQSADTISLNYGTYDAMSIPTTTASASSDIEAFINGQLLEYGASTGYTFDTTGGVVTFNPAISGDKLAVIWRAQDATKTGVTITYTPNYWPGVTPNTTEGIYTVGGTVTDRYGTDFANPTNPDGVRDVHLRMTLTDRNDIYRIQLTDGSQIVAAAGSGFTGNTASRVPIKIFTGGIERTLPFDLSGSGSVTFDMYFTTPSSLTQGGRVYATVFQSGGTTITGVNSSFSVGNTTLESFVSATQEALSSPQDIYSPELSRVIFSVTGTAPYQHQTLNKTVSDKIYLDVEFISANNSLPAGNTRPNHIRKTQWYDPNTGDPVSYPDSPEQFRYYYNIYTGITLTDWNSSDWLKLRVTPKNISAWSKVWGGGLVLSVSTPGMTGYSRRTDSYKFPLLTYTTGGQLIWGLDVYTEERTVSSWLWGDYTYAVRDYILDASADARLSHIKSGNSIDLYVRPTYTYYSSYYGQTVTGNLLYTGTLVLNLGGVELVEDDPEDLNINDPFDPAYTKRTVTRKRIFFGSWSKDLSSFHYKDLSSSDATSKKTVSAQVVTIPEIQQLQNAPLPFVQANAFPSAITQASQTKEGTNSSISFSISQASVVV